MMSLLVNSASGSLTLNFLSVLPILKYQALTVFQITFVIFTGLAFAPLTRLACLKLANDDVSIGQLGLRLSDVKNF